MKISVGEWKVNHFRLIFNEKYQTFWKLDFTWKDIKTINKHMRKINEKHNFKWLTTHHQWEEWFVTLIIAYKQKNYAIFYSGMWYSISYKDIILYLLINPIKYPQSLATEFKIFQEFKNNLINTKNLKKKYFTYRQLLEIIE